MGENKSVVILFSGGADSTLLTEMALDAGYTIHCVLIDYDQNQQVELECATRYLNEKGISYQIVKLHDLGLRSGLTTSEKSLYENVNEMYVPSRNLMFVSIAASIAENNNIDTIWYGADFSDAENGFPDCTQDWVLQVNKLLKINASVPIKLEAPLLGMTKKMILDRLQYLEVNMDNVFSGYLEDN